MESHGQSESETQPPESRPKSGRARHRFRLGAIILLYLLAAYVLIPLAWKWQVRRHPELFDAPRVTHTPNGIPGDPVNVAFLGSEADVIHAMVAAKWDPADPLTFRSTVRIALDSVFRQPELQGKNGAAIRGARMDGLKSPRFISTKAILKSGNEICFAA